MAISCGQVSAASLHNEPDTFYEGKSLEMILLALLSVTRFNKSSLKIGIVDMDMDRVCYG